MAEPTPEEASRTVRLWELFFQALEHDDPADRLRFCESAAGEDAALLERARELLGIHAELNDASRRLFPTEHLPVVLDEGGIPRFSRTLGFRGEGHTAAAGETIAGRYRLEVPVGEGGSGDVFAAIDEITGELVAVKLLRAIGAAAQRTLRREAGLLLHLRLPGVVRILDDGEDEGRSFLVMEYVRGRPLWSEPREARPWDELQGHVVALFEILARVHAAGVVHRDLKPANLLIDEQGRLTLIDLGIARETEYTSEGESLAFTPTHVAPEILAGRPATIRSDLYAVGVMLFTALSGRGPHPGSLEELCAQRCLQDAPPLAEAAPTAPGFVCRLVDGLLRREPRERPGSAQEVLALLRTQGARRTVELELPFLEREGLEGLLAAVRAGRPGALWGPTGSGRTRCLQELAARLAAEGRQPCWAELREGELVAVSAEGRELRGAPLRAALGEGALLVVDAPVADAAPGELKRARAAGAVLSAHGAPGPGRLELTPLSAQALRALFAGPDRVLHRREDGARELWRRTGGRPARVRSELEAWIGSGLALWEQGRVVLTRAALERLAQRTWIGWAPLLSAERAPLSPRLAPLLALIHALGVPARETLARLAGARAGEHPSQGRGPAGPSDGLLPPPAQLDAQLVALEDGGWIAELPEACVVPRGPPPEGLAPIRLDAVLSELPADVHERLRLLVLARRDAEVPAAALASAEAHLRAGRVGPATAAITSGLAAARRTSDPEWLLRLLAERVDLAFCESTARALERALREVDRCGRLADPRVGDLRALTHAGLQTRRANPQPAGTELACLQTLPPRLERWRWSLLLLAARREESPARGLEVLQEALAWAREQADPEIAADAARWEGVQHYRAQDFPAAVRAHEASAALAELPGTRLHATLRAASACMEGFELERARRLAERARSEAERRRDAFRECLAEWLLRATRYRQGQAEAIDRELLAATRALDDADLAGHVHLTEAAIAWQAGDHQLAQGLARQAEAYWRRCNNRRGADVALALSVATGADVDLVRLEKAVAHAREACPPSVAWQILGLVSHGTGRRWVEVEEMRGLGEELPPERWDQRSDVLSLSEALACLEGLPR